MLSAGRSIYKAYSETPKKGITVALYSFGAESPLKLEVSDEYAQAFNRATQAFKEAQLRFRKVHRIEWTPEYSLNVCAAKEDVAAYNAMDSILRCALAVFGKPVTEEDIHDDYLVRN